MSVGNNPLTEAVAEVFNDMEVTLRYPNGLNAADVLTEIRKKRGDDAFSLCSIIDVADECRYLFGR